MASPESPQLVKEVLPPQRPSNGLGVMMVAATAMFFAVASSAFILRARMTECCPPPAHFTPVIIDVGLDQSAEAAVEEDCGKAVYHSDGTVDFKACPDTLIIEDVAEPPPPPPAIEGIVVRRIVHE